MHIFLNFYLSPLIRLTCILLCVNKLFPLGTEFIFKPDNLNEIRGKQQTSGDIGSNKNVCHLTCYTMILAQVKFDFYDLKFIAHLCFPKKLLPLKKNSSQKRILDTHANKNAFVLFPLNMQVIGHSMAFLEHCNGTCSISVMRCNPHDYIPINNSFRSSLVPSSAQPTSRKT